MTTKRRSPRAPKTRHLAARRSPSIERAAVVGLGKAGGSLLASLRRAGVDVVARARRLDALLKNSRIAHADILFLAVPDGALEATARALAEQWRDDMPSMIVAHLAGSRGLDVLDALASHARLASFHPLASLDGRRPIQDKTLVAWDATRTTDGRLLQALARRCGLMPARVRDAARVHYHAGAVVAGNLPVALLALGVRLLVNAGVPEKVARPALARLMTTQADHAAARPLPMALSGPVARGDATTLRRHLDALDVDSPADASLYRDLTRMLIVEVAAHSASTKQRLLTEIERDVTA